MLSYFFIQGKKHFVVAMGKRPLEWKDNLAEIGSFSLFQINDTSNELYFFFCDWQSLQNAFSSDVLVLVEQHGGSEKETDIAPNKRNKKIVSIFPFLCWLPIPNTKLARPGVTSVGTYYTREKLLVSPPWDRETRDWTVCCYHIVKVGQHYCWLICLFGVNVRGELLHTQVRSAALVSPRRGAVDCGQSLFINFELPTDSLAIVVRRRGTGECECRSELNYFLYFEVFLQTASH